MQQQHAYAVRGGGGDMQPRPVTADGNLARGSAAALTQLHGAVPPHVNTRLQPGYDSSPRAWHGSPGGYRLTPHATPIGQPAALGGMSGAFGGGSGIMHGLLNPRSAAVSPAPLPPVRPLYPEFAALGAGGGGGGGGAGGAGGGHLGAYNRAGSGARAESGGCCGSRS
jgi:hypothetical protein